MAQTKVPVGLEQEYPGSWIVMWIVAGREHVQNLLRGGGPTTNFPFCTKVMLADKAGCSFAEFCF